MKTKPKIKVERAKNVMELFHHFANRVFDSEQRSGYSYVIRDDKGFLYKDNSCIVVAYYKKKILVTKKFDYRGAFSSGYTEFDLFRAFKDNYTILYYNSPVSSNWLDILHTNVMNMIYPQLEALYKFKNNPFTDAKWVDIDRTSISLNNEVVNKLCRKLKVKKSDLYNYKFNIRHWFSYQEGGRETSSDVIDIKNTSIKDLLKIKLTDEELKRLEYVKWRINLREFFTRDMANIPRKFTYLEIFNDPELRAKIDNNIDKFKKIHQNYIERKREAAQREREKRYKELQEKNAKRLEDWLNGISIRIDLYMFPCHLRIKDENVETSHGATVPIEDAKKLYRLFKITQSKNETYTNRDRIGNYILNRIGTNGKGEWYITIGCHYIYEEQIEDFINRNKLDW